MCKYDAFNLCLSACLLSVNATKYTIMLISVFLKYSRFKTEMKQHQK